MADNEGLDTWSWAEIKDWRNWGLRRRRPLNRRQLVKLCVSMFVALIVASTVRAAWPHLWVAPLFFYLAAFLAVSLIFDVLARYSRRSRMGPPPFDQERD